MRACVFSSRYCRRRRAALFYVFLIGLSERRLPFNGCTKRLMKVCSDRSCQLHEEAVNVTFNELQVALSCSSVDRRKALIRVEEPQFRESRVMTHSHFLKDRGLLGSAWVGFNSEL